MKALAICSALNNTYFAITNNNNIISKIIKKYKNYHSLYLLSAINQEIKKNNLQLKNLDFICTNIGPGSFTGIRSSLTIAKVIAGELNLPLVPLTTCEILLTAFDSEILIMDARRDMFFVGNKDEIKLVLKNEVLAQDWSNKKIVCDKRTKDFFKNSICYEEKDVDLGKIMLKLAQKKYSNSSKKTEFEYININANYIQTPPVF